MSAPWSTDRSLDDRRIWRPARPDEHAALVEWEAEQDALRQPIPACTCYRIGEFFPDAPCTFCRSRDLAAIDIDGHDDKTETPREVA